MKVRRVLGILFASVLVAVYIWWLQSGHRESPPHPTLALKLGFVGGPDEAEFWRQAAADFVRDYPDAQIDASPVAENERIALERVRKGSFDVTQFDVVLLPLSVIRELEAKFADLGNWPVAVRNALEPEAVEAFRIRGEQRGLPFAGSNLLVYVNRRCFEKASAFHGNTIEFPGDDWTVADFIRMAERLTCDYDRDGVADQYGLWMPDWEHFQPFIWSLGGSLISEDASQWTFSGRESAAAMNLYRQLATGDRVALREGELPDMKSDAALASGTVAMCVGGPSFARLLEKADPAVDYAVAPIPRGPRGRVTSINWSGMAIVRDLPEGRRVAAERFVQWSLSEPVQKRIAEMGSDLPARMDVHEVFVAVNPARRQAFVEALSYSRISPSLPKSEVLVPTIARYFDEAADPARAFRAESLMDVLARDPAVVGAFSRNPQPAP